ncbi:MAG: 50S ribosomal protein L4 [Candidatus Woesebacteria bacterium]|nr:50S ribosomal protein L4 [Candidatus Woesebacteria bacterium]
MLKAKTYSLKGSKLEDTTLPKEFGQRQNLPLLAQAVRVYEERSHIGFAKTKTRTEVNRTTKKVYKQKGTGGARHGARSAPIYVGGGTAHGPKPIRRVLTLPKKMTKLALYQALSAKLFQKQVFVISGIEELAKTKEARDFIKKVAKAEAIKSKKFTFILSDKNTTLKRYLKNLEDVKIDIYKDLNVFNVLFGGTLVFDNEIFAKKVTKK